MSHFMIILMINKDYVSKHVKSMWSIQNECNKVINYIKILRTIIKKNVFRLYVFIRIYIIIYYRILISIHKTKYLNNYSRNNYDINIYYNIIKY